MLIKQQVFTTITDNEGRSIQLTEDGLLQVAAQAINLPQFSKTQRWVMLALLGEKIPAIRALRDAKQLGLREAKLVVERVQSFHFPGYMNQIIKDVQEEEASSGTTTRPPEIPF